LIFQSEIDQELPLKLFCIIHIREHMNQ